jgi:hypothetical protein
MNHSGSGRDGTIDYREGDRSLEIYWEVRVRSKSDRTGSGIFLYMGLNTWKNPEGVKIDKEHRLKILYRLRQWLKDQDISSNVELPPEIETVDQPCMWRDCTEGRVKGSVFCIRHYDLNLLNSLSE